MALGHAHRVGRARELEADSDTLAHSLSVLATSCDLVAVIVCQTLGQRLLLAAGGDRVPAIILAAVANRVVMRVHFTNLILSAGYGGAGIDAGAESGGGIHSANLSLGAVNVSCAVSRRLTCLSFAAGEQVTRVSKVSLSADA